VIGKKREPVDPEPTCDHRRSIHLNAVQVSQPDEIFRRFATYAPVAVCDIEEFVAEVRRKLGDDVKVHISDGHLAAHKNEPVW
jgi:hypothetical protein